MVEEVLLRLHWGPAIASETSRQQGIKERKKKKRKRKTSKNGRRGDAPLEEVLGVEDKGKRMDQARVQGRVQGRIDHGKDAQVHDRLWDKRNQDLNGEAVLLVC